jgi:hypothetical protein
MFIYYKMEKVVLNFNLLCKNSYPNKNSSDIMEHLPILYRYAKECDSVFETGVRGCVSSWAFLYGLLDNKTENKKCLFLNDIDVCDINDLLHVSKQFDNINVTYEWKNNLLLNFKQNYDLTFIDTWHVYGQLKRELNNFSKITNKYIILHDTTIDGIKGETIRLGLDAKKQSAHTGIPVREICKGLSYAIKEFLHHNPEWYIKEVFTNNNGLTILARKSK